jgi:hypothetical protein
MVDRKQRPAVSVIERESDDEMRMTEIIQRELY